MEVMRACRVALRCRWGGRGPKYLVPVCVSVGERALRGDRGAGWRRSEEEVSGLFLAAI